MHRPRASSQNKKRKKPCFFKFFIPGVTDKQLEVPKAFLKHLEEECCGTVLLKGPSGKIWHVNPSKESDGMFLQSGWQRFVKDNSIQVGYCLVFRYYGNFRFRVQIFDNSACEKIDISHERSSCCSTNYENDGEENIVGKKGKKLSNASSLHKACAGNIVCKCPTLSLCKNCEEVSKQNIEKTLPKTQPSKSTEDKVGEKCKRKRGAGSHCNPYISQRRPVTEEEKERTYQAAKSFTSINPTAVVIMRKAYVYYGFYMALPRAFIVSSLPKVSSPMTLYDPNGKEWNTRYIYDQERGTGGLSAGWVSFTLANNIEEYDVCVFELIGSNKMQIHIFRVVDEIAPLSKPCKKLGRSLISTDA